MQIEFVSKVCEEHRVLLFPLVGVSPHTKQGRASSEASPSSSRSSSNAMDRGDSGDFFLSSLHPSGADGMPMMMAALNSLLQGHKVRESRKAEAASIVVTCVFVEVKL